jgi:hypothetical protein
MASTTASAVLARTTADMSDPFLLGWGRLRPRAEALALAVDDMGHREGHVDDVAMAA